MANAYCSTSCFENTRGTDTFLRTFDCLINGIFSFRMLEHHLKIVKSLDVYPTMKYVNFGRIKFVWNNIYYTIYKKQIQIVFHSLNKVHLLISIIWLMQLIFHHQLWSISSMKNSIAILIKLAKIWHLYIEIKSYMYICSFFLLSILY